MERLPMCSLGILATHSCRRRSLGDSSPAAGRINDHGGTPPPLAAGATLTRELHAPRGGTTVRKVRESAVTSAPAALTMTLFTRSCQPALITSESPSGLRDSSQRRWTRASFTSKRSAKSDSTLSDTTHSVSFEE